MTDLSPAAAVLDAVCKNTEPDCDTQHLIAAALRAAADQVVPEASEPDWGACNEMRCDIEVYAYHQRIRWQLLAIAAELEAHQ